MSSAALDACAAIVRRADPDRYLSGLFAPAAARPFLYALYALNHELARIGENVHEPMLGQIRLEWWREAVQGARHGAPRRHEVVEALAAVLEGCDLPVALLDDMIEARVFDVSGDAFSRLDQLTAYLDATSGNLMRLATAVLGEGHFDNILARASGVAYGLVGTMRALSFHARRGKLYVPDEILARAGVSREAVLTGNLDLGPIVQQVSSQAATFYRQAQSCATPGRTLPAILPAALVPIYLKSATRNPRIICDGPDIPVYRRQIAFFRAALRGHV